MSNFFIDRGLVSFENRDMKIYVPLIVFGLSASCFAQGLQGLESLRNPSEGPFSVEALSANLDYTAEPARRVALPEGASKTVKDLYQMTRHEDDCCGVSLIAVFKVDSKAKEPEDRSRQVESVVRQLALEDEAIEWMFSRAVGGEDDASSSWWVSSEPHEGVGLRDFLFPIGGGMFSLHPRFEEATSEVKKLIGGDSVKVVYSAELFPAPSVDGRIDVGLTEDGSYLVAVVFDEGA
jgi:hypothetical protein